MKNIHYYEVEISLLGEWSPLGAKHESQEEAETVIKTHYRQDQDYRIIKVTVAREVVQ